jgi:hypothetical protein
MYLSSIDRTFQRELSILGVTPCCPDCLDGQELVHFRRPTLMVSTQIDQCEAAPDPANGDLARIQTKVKGEMLVDGADGFRKYLIALANTAKQHKLLHRTLDLVDHSIEGHELNIGGHPHGVTFSQEWFTGEDGEEGSAQVRIEILDQLKELAQVGIVSKIRLLGCRTGDDTGMPNLRWLHKRLGILVLGTKRTIDSNDFSETGFCAKDTLVACYSGNASRPHQ